MVDRRITHYELDALARDPEAFEHARQRIGFRVEGGHPGLSVVLFVVLMVAGISALFAVYYSSGSPMIMAGFAVGVLLCSGMLGRQLTKGDRRRARAFLDHGLLPCPTCGCDQHTHNEDGLCPSCYLRVTPGVVRRYWEHIAEHGERQRLFGRELLDIERTSNRATMLAFGVIVIGLAVSSDLARNVLGIPSVIADAAIVIASLGGWLGLCVILWWDSWILKGVRATGPLGDCWCCLRCRHDLRGLDERGVCPECGVAYVIEHVRARWLLKSRRRLESHRSRFV